MSWWDPSDRAGFMLPPNRHLGVNCFFCQRNCQTWQCSLETGELSGDCHSKALQDPMMPGQGSRVKGRGRRRGAPAWRWRAMGAWPLGVWEDSQLDSKCCFCAGGLLCALLLTQNLVWWQEAWVSTDNTLACNVSQWPLLLGLS